MLVPVDHSSRKAFLRDMLHLISVMRRRNLLKRLTLSIMLPNMSLWAQVFPRDRHEIAHRSRTRGTWQRPICNNLWPFRDLLSLSFPPYRSCQDRNMQSLRLSRPPNETVLSTSRVFSFGLTWRGRRSGQACSCETFLWHSGSWQVGDLLRPAQRDDA